MAKIHREHILPSISPDKQPFVAKPDRVNHPSHYTWLKAKCGIEVIDITRHLNFNKGNVIKYTLRSGYKDEEGINHIDKEIEDLNKAIFYLKDEITRLTKCKNDRKP